MIETTLLERKNKKRGRTVSIIVHLLLLLLIFLWTFPISQPKPIYPPPITVEFKFEESSLSKYARAAEGATKKKSESKNPIANKTTPTTKPIETKKPKITPTKPIVKPTKPKPIPTKPRPSKPVPANPVPSKPVPTKPVITDATVDDSPIEVAEEPIEISTDEVLTEEDIAELEEEAGLEEPVEVISKPAGTNSGTKSNDKPSILEGTNRGTGKGKKGSGPGASKGKDKDEGEGTVGTGTGKFDGSGRGVFGRKITKRNIKELFKIQNSTGRIVVKFCVNRAGNTVYAEVLEASTTETDPVKLKAALKAAYGYAVEPNPTAAPEECGKLTFDLNVNLLHGN